jgi:hypothetical protein
MTATSPIATRARSAKALATSVAELDARIDGLARQARALGDLAHGLADAIDMPLPAERTRHLGQLHRALEEIDARLAEVTLSALRLQGDLARAHS